MDNRLKSLNLATPAVSVRRVVLRLKEGHPLHRIYNDDPRWISKKTVEKIRDRWKRGELDFLLQEIEPTEMIDRLYPSTGESHDERVERVVLQGEEDLKDTIAALKIKLPIGYFEDPDGLGVHRMHIIDELPKISWSIGSLEKANIPKEIALSLLSEHDDLNWKRASSEITAEKRWMKDFRGIDRYVALHYLVQFASDHEGAPYDILIKAATLKAKGALELDNRLEMAGENLVRYEVWRENPEYLTAYLEATKKYYGTKRERERLEQEISSLLGETKDEEGQL